MKRPLLANPAKTPRGRLKLDFRRPLAIIGSFSAFGLRGIPDSGLFFRFAADNQQRQVALAHDGFGKAAHQEVHQAGPAVGTQY